jgi:hypothetical protein
MRHHDQRREATGMSEKEGIAHVYDETISVCVRCHQEYDSSNRLQVIRHKGAFCLTSPGIDNSSEAKQRRRAGAKRGWRIRKERTP